jgi:hypothetical protein
MTPKSEILDNLIATIVENTVGDVTATDILTVFQQIIDSYLHQEDSINHNDLANLNLDDYKHLTAIQLTALETIISTYADKIDTTDAQTLANTAESNSNAYADSVSSNAENNAKSYADTLVVGLLDDRGNYDASVDLFPSSGGSGTAGAIKKGDLWTVSVSGTLGGVDVSIGDAIRALSDTPGQTSANWNITENNLGYVPENSLNKKTDIEANKTSNTFFAPIKAIYDWAVGLFQPMLVSGTNIKTINGNSILGSGDLLLDGVFGIPDSNGKYTFYSSLTLAFASASNGQVVEMFADYTETGAVTVTFPVGVSLQGNGHTYKHTHASATHTFKFNQSDKYNVKNLTIERTNATAGAIVLLGTPDLYGGQPAISVYVIADGLTIKTNRYATYGSGTAVFDIVGANIFLSGSGQVYSSTLKKCTVYGDSLSTVTIVQNSTIHNTNVYHLGNQPSLSQCYAFNSTVTATLASACSEMIEVANCYFICGSGTCIAPSGMSPKYSNSLFIAASGVVFGQNSGYCEVNNCTLKSYTNVTVSTSAGVMFNGCRFIAYGSAVVDSGNAYYSNCSFYCYYNNAGGHAFTSRISAINFITNCDFRVTNASANCIYAASATTNKYSGCNFIGATTPVHANVTQGISTTKDNQGNILI